MPIKILSAAAQIYDMNSSGDEIANVNFFTTISHTYCKISKKRTYFV